MRPLAVLLLVTSSLALQGCGNPCQDLGERFCQCSGAGTSRDTCKTEVKNQLNAAKANSSDEAVCSAALDTCYAPAGAIFCEWVNTAQARVACGMAYPPSTP
jgi:hypothetical protein